MNIKREERLIKALDDIINMAVEQPERMQIYIELLKEKIFAFANDLNIGRIVCYVDMPKNMAVPQGEKYSVVLYESDFKEYKYFAKDYKSCDGTKIGMYIYPLSEHEFDDHEKKWIDRLTNIIYISGRKTKLYVMFEKAMNYDLMSGIPNINSLFSFMGKMIAIGKISEYNAFFFNCKNYKYINTHYKYENGSEILKLYCGKLYDYCTEDEIVARLGGDNFVALIKKERTDKFIKMLKATKISYTCNGETLNITISAVAGMLDIKNAMNPSEIMMPISVSYQVAKQILHKDLIVFNSKIQEKLLESQAIQACLHENIKKHEYIVYYQPKNDMRTGKLVGAEALVRWLHDDRLILPGKFIPQLESRGDVCKLDFEVLKIVCRNIRNWLDYGIEPPRISVNFSRWNLTNPNFVYQLTEIADYYRVPHSCLEIELTESGDVAGYNDLNEVFSSLSQRGFITAIDDFGQGYSSLNMILKAKIDILKIDKAFVDEITNEQCVRERLLLASIIRLADDMGMKIIAEGVENEAQKEILIQMGCYYAQGFYFHKPMPAEEFEKLL